VNGDPLDCRPSAGWLAWCSPGRGTSPGSGYGSTPVGAPLGGGRGGVRPRSRHPLGVVEGGFDPGRPTPRGWSRGGPTPVDPPLGGGRGGVRPRSEHPGGVVAGGSTAAGAPRWGEIPTIADDRGTPPGSGSGKRLRPEHPRQGSAGGSTAAAGPSGGGSPRGYLGSAAPPSGAGRGGDGEVGAAVAVQIAGGGGHPARAEPRAGREGAARVPQDGNPVAGGEREIEPAGAVEVRGGRARLLEVPCQLGYAPRCGTP